MKNPVQVNIPETPAPPAPDLKPIHDRLENLEHLTGNLRERMASAETSVEQHLQHASSTEEALALAQSAHNLAKQALSKAEKLAKDASAVPAEVVHDLPAPDPIPETPEVVEPPQPRKSFWSNWL